MKRKPYPLVIPKGYTPPTLEQFASMGSIEQVNAMDALNRHHANISGPGGECTKVRKPLEKLLKQFRATYERQWREFWERA